MNGKCSVGKLGEWIEKRAALVKKSMELDSRTASESDGDEAVVEGASSKEQSKDVIAQQAAASIENNEAVTGSVVGVKKPDNAADATLCDEKQTDISPAEMEAIPTPSGPMEKDSAASLIAQGARILELVKRANDKPVVKEAAAEPVVKEAAAKEASDDMDVIVKEAAERIGTVMADTAAAAVEDAAVNPERVKQAAIDCINTHVTAGHTAATGVFDYLYSFAKSASEAGVDPALMAELAGGAPGALPPAEAMPAEAMPAEAMPAEAMPAEEAMLGEEAPTAAPTDVDPAEILAGAGGAEGEINPEDLEQLAQIMAEAGITPEDLLAAVEGEDMGGMEAAAAYNHKKSAVLTRLCERGAAALKA